ncbi:MAG: hypothetical protein ACTS8S_12780, partial [Giesbergeria sp.]
MEGTVSCVRRDEGRVLRSTPLDKTGAGTGATGRTSAFGMDFTTAFAGDFSTVLAVAFTAGLVLALAAGAFTAVDCTLATGLGLLVAAFNSRLLAVQWVSRGAREGAKPLSSP